MQEGQEAPATMQAHATRPGRTPEAGREIPPPGAMGMWAGKLRDGERRDLKESLARLHAYGYVCFWQTKQSLVAASGPGTCWAEWLTTPLGDTGEPPKGKTANLMCAHEPDVLALLRDMPFRVTGVH